MSIDISHETEARLTEEARRQGVSVDALLERLMSERGTVEHFVNGNGSTPKVPILHLGVIGPLHRRDIYDEIIDQFHVDPKQVKAVLEFAARSLDFSPIPTATTVASDARSV